MAYIAYNPGSSEFSHEFLPTLLRLSHILIRQFKSELDPTANRRVQPSGLLPDSLLLLVTRNLSPGLQREDCFDRAGLAPQEWGRVSDPLDTFKGGLAAILRGPRPSIAQTNQVTLTPLPPIPPPNTLPMAVNLPTAGILSPAHPHCRLVGRGGIER